MRMLSSDLLGITLLVAGLLGSGHFSRINAPGIDPQRDAPRSETEKFKVAPGAPLSGCLISRTKDQELQVHPNTIGSCVRLMRRFADEGQLLQARILGKAILQRENPVQAL